MVCMVKIATMECKHKGNIADRNKGHISGKFPKDLNLDQRICFRIEIQLVSTTLVLKHPGKILHSGFYVWSQQSHMEIDDHLPALLYYHFALQAGVLICCPHTTHLGVSTKCVYANCVSVYYPLEVSAYVF